MREQYSTLANNLLHAYHTKVMNLKAATAIAAEVRANSTADHAFRLSVGLEGLQTVAKAACDDEAYEEIERLISKVSCGHYPIPGSW
ncbi:hypothetical protein [Erwinia sp. LJJL01]|uniref:hypothetical protein n=1 Tax=Erwinia sp. LJJL01 TaxID=3391839 RepID=UPI00105B502F